MAKNKISRVAGGPDLRQNKMTQEWAPSCSAVSRLTAAGTGKRSRVDLGTKHSSDDQPRSGSQDPTHSTGRDSRRRSIGRDSQIVMWKRCVAPGGLVYRECGGCLRLLIIIFCLQSHADLHYLMRLLKGLSACYIQRFLSSDSEVVQFWL